MSEIKEIDYIYKSYLKAEPHLEWNTSDEYKRNPEFTKEILNKLSGYNNILVTGSKGKGSISNFISSILNEYIKTGIYTNPHITNFNERFKINNEEISDEDLKKYILKSEKYFDNIESHLNEKQFISPIGIQAAIALGYFNDNKTDFNIFECGKGVKYDDINNLNRSYAIISTIFLEHTRELGSTLKEIAENKSYIIKNGEKCVYSSIQEKEVLNVLKNRALNERVVLKVYGENFYAKNIRFSESGMIFDVVTDKNMYNDLNIKLLGVHQCYNAAVAIQFCEDYLGKIDLDVLKKALLNVKIYGRSEIINKDPFIILDAVINRKSAEFLKKILGELDFGKYNFIIGIPDDKDYMGVVKEVYDISNKIILTKTHNPHYKFTSIQKDNLESQGYDILESDDIKDAMNMLKDSNIPLCILGTTSLITEVKSYF